MRPGIVVQHGRLPVRSRELVRCDVTAFIGFIPEERWPEGMSAGDFIEVPLRREPDLWEHPHWRRLDQASVRAVHDFFVNNGDSLFLFGVCIHSQADFETPAAAAAVVVPLFDRLRAEDDIAVLAAPALAWLPVSISRLGEAHTDAEHVYDLLLAHCREMNNRFLILDPPRGLHGEPLVRWVRDFREREQHTRSYGALYYPWLFEGEAAFPPSASVAGIYARLEKEKGDYGVVWPPANVPVQGVTHLELDLSFEEAGDMAEMSVNPIILQAGRGIVVFGARTLSTDKAYRFINSRRVISMITEQLRRDNEWAVFETNNPHLWDVLERDVRYRLEQFWRAGLLSGERAGEQYAVTCNTTNNPRYLLDSGQVNVEIRMRPVGTAEQIVIDLRLGG
ncbi:MAG: phage tail sheath subtilisin-like domain-containing protein [Myxococcota bacterium]|nr:phage tail sheath subtilisin-like domain-containing protein [Myxococcota bacterium]